MPTLVSSGPDLQNVLEGFDCSKQNLIPILQEVQEAVGFISKEAILAIADYLDLSPHDVYGVATFYAQFRFQPPGEHRVKVCQGTACHVRGSGLIQEALIKKLGIAPGETTPDLKFSLERVACFGSCALAPLMVVNDEVFGRMTVRHAQKIVGALE